MPELKPPPTTTAAPLFSHSGKKSSSASCSRSVYLPASRKQSKSRCSSAAWHTSHSL